MKIIYVLHPGPVISRSDGNIHQSNWKQQALDEERSNLSWWRKLLLKVATKNG